jgi:hypothetical protein
MNTAIQTPSCPSLACTCQGHSRFRRLWETLRSKAGRWTLAGLPDSVSHDDPWSTAVGQIQHLDAHVLADIGAPRWVIDEVNRRQCNDGILDMNRKW